MSQPEENVDPEFEKFRERRRELEREKDAAGDGLFFGTFKKPDTAGPKKLKLSELNLDHERPEEAPPKVGETLKLIDIALGQAPEPAAPPPPIAPARPAPAAAPVAKAPGRPVAPRPAGAPTPPRPASAGHGTPPRPPAPGQPVVRPDGIRVAPGRPAGRPVGPMTAVHGAASRPAGPAPKTPAPPPVRPTMPPRTGSSAPLPPKAPPRLPARAPARPAPRPDDGFRDAATDRVEVPAGPTVPLEDNTLFDDASTVADPYELRDDGSAGGSAFSDDVDAAAPPPVRTPAAGRLEHRGPKPPEAPRGTTPAPRVDKTASGRVLSVRSEDLKKRNALSKPSSATTRRIKRGGPRR